jgi:hypothetical protein
LAEITVFHDVEGQTLTIWFGSREDEFICDHTDSDVIVMEDARGRPLGIEVLNFQPLDDQPLTVTLRALKTSKPREPARVP